MLQRIRLDVHAHLIPFAPGDQAGAPGVECTARGLLRLDAGDELALRQLYSPQSLVDWMDKNGVERAWVSIPPTLYRLALDASQAQGWTRAANAALCDVAARTGGRLEPLLHLPVQHPSVAAEIAQAACAGGLRRFAMPAGSADQGLMLSEPRYGALWRALDAGRAFLFLHPSRGCDPRLDRYYLQNLLGNPQETAIAAAHLAISGVLERHPGITFCLAHGGGAAAAVAGRLERGQLTGRPGSDTGAWPARRAFRRFCVDCITHDRAGLELAAATFGEDHVLFGSDWPFAMGLPAPHAQLADVPTDLRRRLFDDNPARLLRDAELPAAAQVMSPRRAAAVTASPLAFTRSAMRELVRGRWRIEKQRFDLDAEGRGEILYRLTDGRWTFHFFLVSLKLDEAQKLDRNWAQSWDAMGVLCQGDWTPQREALLREEVPRQRAGFADYDTLVYARGNRSGRMFDHVVESLAAGGQPDLGMIAEVGYILRTTAFIANGQLGTRAYAGLEPDHPFRRPYHAQMASAFLLREYVFDLVDHMARARSPAAARLDPAYRRYLGLGNAAATGLVAFVVNHPHLMHCWSLAHQRALAEARSRRLQAGDPLAERFGKLLDKAIRYFREGTHGRGDLYATAATVAGDLERFRAAFARRAADVADWPELCSWAAQNLGAEACEVVDALVLELHPDIAEASLDAFHADERFDVRPAMRAAALRDLLGTHFGWALAGEFAEAAQKYFWFRAISAPRDVRRGIRGLLPVREAENGMDTVLRLQELHVRLRGTPEETTTAEFLCRHPELRHIVARVQSLAGQEYADLRANWLAADFSPFAPVRFVLAFYGMEKFEAVQPKQVRGAFLQGAPIAEDVASGRDGDWPFPLIPAPGSLALKLAPLPPAGLGAAGDRPRPAAREVLRIAPYDLARTAAAAIQARGAALGVAEEAADLLVFAQGCGQPAIAALLRQFERGFASHDIGIAQAGPDGANVRLDAGGAAAILAAPASLDLACAGARGASNLSTVLVERAESPAFLGWIALRCAERGLSGVVAWRLGDGAVAMAAAGPGAAGPWIAQVAVRDLALVRASALGIFGVPAAALFDHAAMDKSFGVIATHLAAVDLPGELASLCAGEGGQAWCSAEAAERRAAWHRQGLPLAARDLASLERAAAALHMPVEDLPRVRPGESTDPLKVF
jgi:aminocarboxymuconate-semialdehyde decarboxylase